MVETTGEIVIARPRADVFAVLADPTRIPAWRADIIEAAPLDDTRGIGARYREVMSFMGKKSQTFEVVEYESGARLTVRAIAGMSLRPLQRFELEDEGGATRLRYRIELPVTGLFRIMSPMLRKMIPSKWRSYAEALKTTLEA